MPTHAYAATQCKTIGVPTFKIDNWLASLHQLHSYTSLFSHTYGFRSPCYPKETMSIGIGGKDFPMVRDYP